MANCNVTTSKDVNATITAYKCISIKANTTNYPIIT